MNREIAQVMAARLQELEDEEYITKLSGLVRVLELAMPDDPDKPNGKKTKRKVPVPFEPTVDGSLQGAAMTPDSGERCIVYFEEDGQPTFAEGAANAMSYSVTSRLRLVCWFNQKGFTPEEGITSRLEVMLIRQLQTAKDNPFPDLFTGIRVTGQSFGQMNAALFSKYTYDESYTQYLSYPYGYFGINLTITYFVPYDCVNEIGLRDFRDCCDD